MSPSSPRILRFGPFELDVRAAELRKHGIKIRLQDQSFQILLMLLNHPGEVVLREEIRLKLWPNNTVVEFDHSINAAIKRLRNALGETAEDPHYIETLAKRGYRFAGEVERSAPSTQPLPSTATDVGGRIVAHYRVLDKLGQGGMGVVYRAEDTKLGRQVALKFLPAPAAEIPSTILQRFEREARAASALNHPNICTIYGLEDCDGQPAIVMEFVEGETLAARLMKGLLPRDESLRVAIQTASALAEAHRKGIVHRDLKPANLMLTRSGIVKVLDFGLAKMERPVAPVDETATMAGAILGTPHYMSPEQARGEESDARSDIFSFGIVLYEMLAGKRPFDATSAPGVMAAILERDPPPLDAIVPAALERVVRRCLAKDPDGRWQSARDLQAELEWILSPSSAERPAAPPVFPSRRLDWRWLAIGALLVLSLVLAVAFMRQSPAEPPLVRFSIYPPEGAPFGSTLVPAVSPDGKRILYITTWKQKYQLWLRSLDSTEAVPLLGGDGSMLAIGQAFWSPDSKSVAFIGDDKLQRLDLDRPGGPGQAVPLCDAPDSLGGSWSRNGVILFARFNGTIYRVADTGGTPKPVTRLDESRRETSQHSPWFLPDGRHFLYSTLAPPFPWANKTIRVGSIDSEESHVLLKADSQATFARGHIFFVLDDNLLAQPFDPGTFKITGEAVGIASRVPYGSSLSPFSAVDQGPLVYGTGAGAAQQELVWYDRAGNRLSTVTQTNIPNFPFMPPRLSPDQRTIVYPTSEKGLTDLWTFDLERKSPSRLTFDQRGPVAAVWSPDGQSIAYTSLRGGHLDIYRKLVNGTGSEELLYSDAEDKYPTSWSPDGKYLLYDRWSYKQPTSIWILPVTAEGVSPKPTPLGQTAAGESGGAFSPDGRWITYTTLESGRSQVYLVPFADGASMGGKRQISTSTGAELRWRKDGKEIYYKKGRSLVAASININGAGVQIGEEHELIGSVSIFGYDVSSDGQRFLLCLRPRQLATQPLTVLENWTQLLKNPSQK